MESGFFVDFRFAKFWVLDSSQLDFKFEVLLDVPEN
jgi:hypothetical protein